MSDRGFGICGENDFAANVASNGVLVYHSHINTEGKPKMQNIESVIYRPTCDDCGAANASYPTDGGDIVCVECI